jgi:hypothetical protein
MQRIHILRRSETYRFVQATFLVAVVFFADAASLAADTIVNWTGGRIGDWTAATNWTPQVIPNNIGAQTFDVRIDQYDTNDFQQVRLGNEDIEISRLDLRGIVFKPNWLFRIRNFFQLRAGGIGGGGLTEVVGDAEFSGPEKKSLGSPTHLYGNSRWTGGDLNFGLVHNHQGAIFDVETPGELAWIDSLFLNEGVLRLRSAGRPIIVALVTNTPTGVIDVETGNPFFYYKVEGSGIFRTRPGSKPLVGMITLAGMKFENAGELNLRSVEVKTDTEILGRVVLTNMSSSGISGPANLTVDNLIWQGGMIGGGGVLIVSPGGTAEATPNSGEGHFLTRPLSNRGLFRFHDGTRGFGGYRPTNETTGQIILDAGSTFEAQGMVNHGVITKDLTSGTSDLSTSLDGIQNSGVIRASAGTLNIDSDIFGGELEATAGGRISVLGDVAGIHAKGAGHVEFEGKFSGSFDTNVTVTLRSVQMTIPQQHRIRNLTLGRFHLWFNEGGTVEALEHLTLDTGIIHNGVVCALSNATVAINPLFGTSKTEVMTLRRALLETHGATTWRLGTIEVGFNSRFENLGMIQPIGSGRLSVVDDGRFENVGPWTFAKSASNATLRLSPTAAQISTDGSAMAAPSEPSGLAIAGPFSMTTNGLALTNASMRLTSAFATNSNLRLVDSRLELAKDLVANQSVLHLTRSRVVVGGEILEHPILKGDGVIEGYLRSVFLTLALDTTNRVELIGRYGVYGELNIPVEITRTNSQTRAPLLIVNGPTRFSGVLNLDLQFDRVGRLPTAMPSLITLMECSDTIDGQFYNAPCGFWATSADGQYRFRAFYGTNSPYGANKLIVTDIVNPYDAWAAGRFSPDELERPEISGFAADPDGNGYSNAAEYAFRIVDGVGAPAIHTFPTTGVAILTASIVKGTEAFLPRVAFSTNLVTWTEFTPGGAAEPFYLERSADFDDFQTFWYRLDDAPAEMFLRSSVRLPVFAP